MQIEIIIWVIILMISVFRKKSVKFCFESQKLITVNINIQKIHFTF